MKILSILRKGFFIVVLCCGFSAQVVAVEKNSAPQKSHVAQRLVVEGDKVNSEEWGLVAYRKKYGQVCWERQNAPRLKCDNKYIKVFQATQGVNFLFWTNFMYQDEYEVEVKKHESPSKAGEIPYCKYAVTTNRDALQTVKVVEQQGGVSCEFMVHPVQNIFIVRVKQ